MTAVTLRQCIDELIAQHGTLRAASAVLRIDCGYLARLRNGDKTEPGSDVLRKLKLRKIVAYERVERQEAAQPRLLDKATYEGFGFGGIAGLPKKFPGCGKL